MIDHRSYTHNLVVKLKPEKKFTSEQDLNPWTLRYRCSALLTELSSHLGAGHKWGLPRGLRDKRHCVKMWRQFVSKVPTADRSWHERGDNLRQRQSIFHFDKATTALFFFDGDMTVMTWLDKASVTLWSSIVCVYGKSVVQILTETNHHSTLFTKS